MSILQKTTFQLSELEKAFLDFCNDKDNTFQDFSTFLKLARTNRVVGQKKQQISKAHPWFKSASDIFRLLKIAKTHTEFVRLVEKDQYLPQEIKEHFMHWFCTTFPQCFPLTWSLDETGIYIDVLTESLQFDSILIPPSVDLEALCNTLYQSSCAHSNNEFRDPIARFRISLKWNRATQTWAMKINSTRYIVSHHDMLNLLIKRPI